MYIKGFKINIDRNKRLWGAILFAIFIAIVLIVFSFIYIFKVSNSNLDNKYTKIQLFDAKSFYAEYRVNVYSNKNKNEYRIKEWYLKNGDEYNFRIEANYGENSFVYLGTNDTISIKANDQISKMDLSYDSAKSNMLSISTFVELYNEINEQIENNSKCCNIDEIEHDDNLSYVVKLNSEGNKNADTNFCKICSKFINNGMKVSKFELIIQKGKLIPKEYIIYDNSGNTYIDIMYDNFVINMDFDKKVFAF